MTSRLSTRGLGRRLAMITAATALMIGLGTASAFAAEISVEPSEGLAASGATEVTVTGSGFGASEELRVGLCSAETYGVLGIPACGAMEDIVADGEGEISATIDVEKENANVHASIPFPLNLGQPAKFICAGEPEDDVCEVSVASHGGAPTILASQEVSFE